MTVIHLLKPTLFFIVKHFSNTGSVKAAILVIVTYFVSNISSEFTYYKLNRSEIALKQSRILKLRTFGDHLFYVCV